MSAFVVVEDGRLLAVKEVAAILSISRDSVVRLIKNGELEALELPPMGGFGKNVTRLVSERAVRRFKERRAATRKLKRFFES